jgi:hypothetical protein
MPEIGLNSPFPNYNNPQKVNPNSFPKSEGQPLPPSLKHEYEASFGADLANVNIYKDSHVPTIMKADMFRDGSDIHFAPGVDPYSEVQKETLAHELAHVVQQSGNPSGNPEAINAGQSAAEMAAGVGR